MSSTLYIGEKNALTFPVMCDGYLRVDYSDAIAEEPYGIFEHDKSFTVEAIITPFDINGAGWKIASHEAVKGNNPAGTTGVTDSIRTMPTVQTYNTTASHYQSHTYRDEANRITDKMVLFHNDNLQLYLQNSTLTTQNQPAEYKIGMIVNAASDDTLVTSNPVIKSSLAHVGETDTATVYHSEDSTVKYEPIGFTDATCDLTDGDATVTCDANALINVGMTVSGNGVPAGATVASINAGSAGTNVTSFELSAVATATNNNQTLTFGLVVNAHTSGQATFTYKGTKNADDYFSPKQELFIRDGQLFTSIGTVNSAASSSQTVTLDAVVNTDLDNKILYTHAKREATYLLNSFHIAWALDITNGRMTIYLNGDVVATKIHTDYGSGSFPFYIAAEDTYIGQDPSTGASTQFMGQVHEFAFLDNYKTEFNSLYTLAPNYRDTLLYYRFEEIDE
jgi:hypothetical protein